MTTSAARHLGFFGEGDFGEGYFGVQQSGAVLLSGTVISAALLELMARNPQNSQQVAGSVTIGGVDVSALVESVSLSSSADGATGLATLVLIGGAPVSAVEDAAVELAVTITFATGEAFTNSLFAGMVKTIQPSTGSTRQTTVVTCFDDAYNALMGAPANTAWTGTARDLVADELTAAGITAFDLDFADYSIDLPTLGAFATVRDLVLAVAGGKDEVCIYRLSTGVLAVRSYTSSEATGLTMQRAGYCSSQDNTQVTSRYASVTVTGSAGNQVTVTDSAIGVDGNHTAPVLDDTADLTAKANAMIARSKRVRRSLVVPLIPVLRVGSSLQVVHTDLSTYTATVIGRGLYGQWTGPGSSPGWFDALTLEVAA